MSDHIHLLPVGFDTWRLTEPLVSTDHDIERAIIVIPAGDNEPERLPKSGGETAFAARNRRNIQRELEPRVPLTEVEMPPLHEFEQVYAWAHRYLGELMNEAIIHVNISSLPRSAVTAIVQAATALRADDPAADSRLDIYYVPVDRYLGVEAFDTMRRNLSHREQMVSDVSDYLEIEPALFRAIVDPIQERIDTLDQQIEVAIKQLDQRPTGDDKAHDKLIECQSELQRARDEFDAARAGEEGDEENWEPIFSQSDIVNPKPHIIHCSELLATLPSEAVSSQTREALGSDAAELEQMVKRFKRIQDVLSFHRAVIQDMLPGAEEEVVEEISQYGLTRGSIRADDELGTISIPAPPTRNVREMEVAILFVLSQNGAASSIKELGDLMASRLVNLLDQQLDATEPMDVLESESIKQVRTLSDMEGREPVLTKLRNRMSERLRSRLQYNLEQLAEKGYVRRRQATDDSRRTSISLSQMGQLWGSTHDYDVEGVSAVATLLEEELQKTEFVTDG